MNMTNAGVVADDQRAHIANLLSRYPDNTEAELAELGRWFKRSATALDIGILASDPATADAYRAYRAAHVDRFKPADLIRAAAFIAVVAAVFVLIALLVP